MSQPKPSWKLRRRAVFTSLIFAWAVIIYVALRWDDTALAETLVLSAFASAATVITAYIGGAAYEDVRLHEPSPEPEPIDTTPETEGNLQ